MKTYKEYTLPETYSSWEEYAKFLLSELPSDVADNYRKKLKTSQKFWQEKGGALSKLTCDALILSGIPFQFTGKVSKTGKMSITMNYADDYNFTDFKAVPTYKRFAICILRGDVHCCYMGFAEPKKGD